MLGFREKAGRWIGCIEVAGLRDCCMLIGGKHDGKEFSA